MSSTSYSSVASALVGTLVAIEPYGPTDPVTIYTFAPGQVAQVETVYVRCHADGLNQDWDGSVSLRMIDPSGLVLYQQATPYFTIAEDEFENPDEFEFTWARGAAAASSQTGELGTPASGQPNFAWATVPLPDVTMRGGSMIQLQGFFGYVVGQLVSNLDILSATVTLDGGAVSDTTAVQGIPLLTPTDSG